MAGQSVLCIVINDLTFFLLFGCRRKFSFSLSNPDTACHFHFFLHTHKHTHTLFGLVKMYTFLCSSCLHFHRNCFFVSLVSMEENFFIFFHSFYFCTCTCTHTHTHTHFVVLKRNVYISVSSRPWCREKKNPSFFQVLFVLLSFFFHTHTRYFIPSLVVVFFFYFSRERRI